jgi:ureidoglycolate lyase
LPLTARDPDPAAFAPFGAFVQPPAAVGERSMFGRWLEPVAGLSQQCHLNRVTPSTLPLSVDRVECHPHACQLFLPIQVSRYLVTVMPSDEDGAPDSARALAFLLPGTLGVVYHPGTWHAGISVLDAEATFAVLMWRGGEEDDVFAPIPRLEVHAPVLSVEVHPAGAAAIGRVHG